MPSGSKASAEGGVVIDDGCGGACGGVGGLCFEADPEFVKTDERWVYVGQGRGTYSQAASMDYVGHGRGDFEKEKVTVSSGVRFRAICVFFICFLLFVIVGLLIYFFMPHFFYSPVGADDPCQTSATMDQMTVIQREACCANGYGAFCATTPKAPVIIHDKFYTNVRTQRVAHSVPVPIPGPPAKVITRKVYVKHHPYDCTEGYGNWKTQWSHEHQRYCCYKFKESCVTKVQYRNHYKTITRVHHVTVPEKVVVPAPPPREINHIVHVPVHDPSPVIKIKTAGPPRVVKHYVTKKHYVPEPVPSPPTYHYKPVPVTVHVPGKVVHVPVPMPAKTIYKEIPITKVQHVIQKRYYDCVAGIKNWHYGWSKTKKSWCCSHEQKGCPGTWQGDGLTKTIVTGVTQHIGHGHVGHVHVIHHVHHYSTSSHDIDDLPDVIGDDDASLPPEYRHGDMSVGGEDESLPPEYRDGDMSIADADGSLPPEYRQGDISIGSDEESLPSEYRHGDLTLGGDEESLPPEYRDGDSMGGDDDGAPPPRKLSAVLRGRQARRGA